ncbi:hypothetical protein CEXT_758021 [Caerostris extrusa]|uniref:Uncharacterized protein n=1 Tax=Caerostris extrusa TaxID=172846 RepID=A0AAV4U7K6_CAEEX|nr:hypothetical protein CEXT_758021 [Caerostris extrusa]
MHEACALDKPDLVSTSICCIHLKTNSRHFVDFQTSVSIFHSSESSRIEIDLVQINCCRITLPVIRVLPGKEFRFFRAPLDSSIKNHRPDRRKIGRNSSFIRRTLLSPFLKGRG